MNSQAKQATPHSQLIAELLDSRVPKTEREHAAVREIERLRIERDEHARWRAKLADDLHDRETQIIELRRQLAEAEQDAERYRWLRSNREFCVAAYPEGEWVIPAGMVFLGYSNPDADSWIDAAMDLTRPAEE